MDIERTAREFQTELYRFADLSAMKQTGKLRDMLLYVRNTATPDVLESLSNPDFQRELATCMNLTFRTPIHIPGGSKPLNMWRGCATIVAFGTEGTFFGFRSIKPKVTKLYGNNPNFAIAPVSKAVAEHHLRKAGKDGGIEDNIDYLQDFDFPFHAGAISVPNVGIRTGYHMGATACEGDKREIARLLDIPVPGRFKGMLLRLFGVEPVGPYTFAGNLDTACVEITSDFMERDPRDRIRSSTTSRTINRTWPGN